jgi:O-antigen ligase
VQSTRPDRSHGHGDPAHAADIDHPSTRTGDRVLAALAWLLGASSVLGRFLDSKFGGLHLSLALGVLFGTFGWWQGVNHPILRRYLRWAVPFVTIGVIGLLASDVRDQYAVPIKFSFDESGAKLLWFMLVPGIAVLLQNRRLFRALFKGLVFGASVYLLVALQRAMQGQPALNRSEELLQTHRNIVDMIVVGVVPAVLSSSFLGWRKLTRYAYVAGTIAWLISSSGRAGMLALILCPLVLFMLTPSKSGKPVGPRIAVAAALGFLMFNVLSNVTISWLPAASRLSQSTQGDRTDSDEIRILLLKKAYTQAWKHPAFGIGIGGYTGSYDPVVEKARNDHVRQQALALQAHNTYVETLASTGFVGVLLFIGMLIAPLAAAMKYVQDRDMRAIAAGYCVVLFVITFHTSLDTRLFIPMAMTLAMAVRCATAGVDQEQLEPAQYVRK